MNGKMILNSEIQRICEGTVMEMEAGSASEVLVKLSCTTRRWNWYA